MDREMMLANGKRIEESRKEAGMTRREVYELLGVPKRTYDDWEFGNRSPKVGVDTIIGQIKALSVLTDEAREQIKSGAWSIQDALDQYKIEAARKFSKWGAYGGTFTANLSRIPASVIGKCDSTELAALVDAIKAAYDDGYQAGRMGE